MYKPKIYYQTDGRWKANAYRTSGESSTIGSAGCGITCAAMVIATLKDASVTPPDTAKWSMNNGFKYLNQGTAYSYFKPQFAKYGIKCEQINTNNTYGQTSSSVYDQVKSALRNGKFVIAVMGPGNWTKGGHYVLCYGLKDGYVYINDPASSASNRTKATFKQFCKEAKYFWKVTVYEKPKEKVNAKSSFGQIAWLQSRIGVDPTGKWNASTTRAVRKAYKKHYPRKLVTGRSAGPGLISKI